jgi:hypothetical protein
MFSSERLVALPPSGTPEATLLPEPPSGSLEEREFDHPRHLYRNKPVGRVQVVFAVFINDANQIVGLGSAVRKNDVELVALQ